MNKKIIKLNESELRKEISEAVSEMLRTRRNGLPDPVFSTDNPNTSWAKRIKKDEDSDNIQNTYFGWGPIRNDMSNLINARSNGEDAQLPRFQDTSIGNWDKALEDEFADEIADNKRYYENPEGTENIWYDQEEPEPVEVRENVVKLKEAQLKKIVAESVKNVISEIGRKTYESTAVGYDMLPSLEDDEEPEIDDKGYIKNNTNNSVGNLIRTDKYKK